MNYVKVIDGVASKYSIAQFKKDNPNLSIPANPSNDFLQRFSIFPYIIVAAQEDINFHTISDKEFIYEDNMWKLIKQATPISQDQAEEVARAIRTKLLSATDWTQVNDSKVNVEAWAAYRQELRDVTSQSGFPYNILWPTEPSS
jgi:hypothetical protein